MADVEAEYLGRTLGQHGGRALSDLGRAGQERDRAVEVELEIDRGVRLAGPVLGLGRAAHVMRAGHAEAPARPELALAALPAARLLDPVDAFRQAIALHHQVVLGEAELRHQVPAPDLERIEAQLLGHLVHQVLEGEAHVDRAVAAHGAAGRRVGEHAVAVVAHRVQVVDGIEHGAGIEDGDDAVAGIGPAPLHHLAVDGDDLAGLVHADFQARVGFGPAPVRDEGLFPALQQPDPGPRGLRKHGANELADQGFRARAEAAADMGLDHPDLRIVEPEALRDIAVYVVGHLGAGMHGEPLALIVPFGDGRVGLHMDVVDFLVVVRSLAHQVRARQALVHVAELELGVPLDIARPLGMEVDGVRRAGLFDGVISRQLLVDHLDQVERPFRGGDVAGRHGRDRFAAIAHALADQRELVHGDGQDAERDVTGLTREHDRHARQLFGFGSVDRDDLGVAVGRAQDAADELVGGDEVGAEHGLAGDFLDAVHQRAGFADGAHAGPRAHAAAPWTAKSAAAVRPASMIFT